MISKDLLKAEIDKVPEEPSAEWRAWIAETYGCMADAPIERGEQRGFEVRELLEEPL